MDGYFGYVTSKTIKYLVGTGNGFTLRCQAGVKKHYNVKR